MDVSPELRTDISAQDQTFAQQDFLEQQAPELVAPPTAEQWQTLFTPTQWNLVNDSLLDDEEIPDFLESELEAIAAAYGLTLDQMLTLIEESIEQQGLLTP